MAPTGVVFLGERKNGVSNVALTLLRPAVGKFVGALRGKRLEMPRTSYLNQPSTNSPRQTPSRLDSCAVSWVPWTDMDAPASTQAICQGVVSSVNISVVPPASSSSNASSYHSRSAADGSLEICASQICTMQAVIS